MDTIARGNGAEAAVLFALAHAGIPVYLPFGEGSPFDLVAVMPENRLLRIQVKCGRVRKGCVEFNSSSTDHGRGQLSYRGRADVFAVRVPALDQIYVIDVEDCPEYRGYLRLDPPRNNQRLRVRFAADHTFERWVASEAGRPVAA